MRISLFFILPQKFIKNANIPACQQCIHFSPESKCTKFGEKDIITNKIYYNSAKSCRKNESECGEKGIYFEQDTLVNIYFSKFREPIIFVTGIFFATVIFINLLEFLR